MNSKVNTINNFELNVKLSVCCISFNQKEFIIKSLDGILAQKTDFRFEIIIHDDASTDGTKEIIESFQEKYPDIIFPYYQKENQYSKGVRGFMAKYNYPRCRGKYIALCEGDDYWTDPYKLQKQVDFLEANSEYSLVFHKTKAIQKGQLVEDNVIENRFDKVLDKSNILTTDLLRIGNFIHTCSVVFRRDKLLIPKEMNFSPVGDYILFISLSQQGKIKRLEEEMAVYRKGSGSYSSLSPIDMQRKIIQYHLCILSMLTNEEERIVFLDKTLNEIKNFEKQIISVDNLALKKTMLDIIKTIIKKATRIFKLN